MKRITKFTLFAAGLTFIASLAGISPGLRLLAESQQAVQFARESALIYDVACDCRTGVFGANRGDVFIVQGKIFPRGTLPSGDAGNDPTLPVNGISPIGNWICRGQNSFPLPPAVAAAYSSTPAAFNTQYFILDDGRALTAEGYDILPSGEHLSVTGGVADFSGAGGFIEEGPLGTNSTGCPNFRAKFKIHPGSARDK